jgi:hypothetical protein
VAEGRLAAGSTASHRWKRRASPVEAEAPRLWEHRAWPMGVPHLAAGSRARHRWRHTDGSTAPYRWKPPVRARRLTAGSTAPRRLKHRALTMGAPCVAPESYGSTTPRHRQHHGCPEVAPWRPHPELGGRGRGTWRRGAAAGFPSVGVQRRGRLQEFSYGGSAVARSPSVGSRGKRNGMSSGGENFWEKIR